MNTSASLFRSLVERTANSALNNPYQHYWLVRSCFSFDSFLRERGLSFFPDGLQSLWAAGILRPVVIETELPVDPGQRAWLAPIDGSHSVDVRPLPRSLSKRWSTELGQYTSEAKYHPFQVWQAKIVSDHLLGRIAAISALGTSRNYVRLARHIWRGNRDSVSRLVHDGALFDSYRLVSLLLDIAPISLPRITQRIIGGILEPVEDYPAWRRGHRSDLLMARHSVSMEDFRRWHHDLSFKATLADPLFDWFDLIEQVDIEHRKPLEQSMFAPEGKARLAQDLYLMAKIIRSYAGEYLNLELPEEDVDRAGPQVWRERVYGSRRVTEGRRDVRRRIARRYGLDSGIRFVWFVEGETELGFIDAFCAEVGIRLDNRGILVQNLKGHGGLGSRRHDKFDRRLAEARREEQFTFVTLDDEGDARARLRALAEQEVITAGFRLWSNGSVETANFSDAELAQVVALYLGLPSDKVFSGAQLSAQRERTSNLKKAINACLKGPDRRLQTGREWGSHLALWALAHRAPLSRRENQERPMIRDLLEIFRGADTSFLETVARSRVGQDGRLAPRTGEESKE